MYIMLSFRMKYFFINFLNSKIIKKSYEKIILGNFHNLNFHLHAGNHSFLLIFNLKSNISFLKNINLDFDLSKIRITLIKNQNSNLKIIKSHPIIPINYSNIKTFLYFHFL